MNEVPLIIMKVGGSLYDLPDLSQRLQAAIRQVGLSRVVLFPGGGAMADVVRDWHRRFQFDEELAHQFAVRSLSVNADLLLALVPDSHKVDDVSPRGSVETAGTVTVLDPALQLEGLERSHPETAPPHNWDVTSDSLAAWVAFHSRADRLVLLKSVPCPGRSTLLDAMRAGAVDPYMPGIAGRLPAVDWCNLRADNRIQPWLIAGTPMRD